MTPARKLTHTTKFEHFWMQKDMNFGNAMILHHLGPENCQKSTQKDMNFGNAIILHYLGPENHQNPTTKDTNFKKLHSLTPANKESIRFFPEVSTIFKMHSLTPSTLTKQSPWEHLVARFLQLQTNCDTFGQ